MNIKTLALAGLVVVIAGGVFITNRAKTPPAPIPAYEPTPTVYGGYEAPSPESRYSVYSKHAFDAAKGKKRVYFFHAAWCPTCKAANTEFTNNLDGIPEGVIVFKTDYDTNSELKKQYGITYQHTYVLVDENGKELKKWNGGAIAELIANTK